MRLTSSRRKLLLDYLKKQESFWRKKIKTEVLAPNFVLFLQEMRAQLG